MIQSVIIPLFNFKAYSRNFFNQYDALHRNLKLLFIYQIDRAKKINLICPS